MFYKKGFLLTAKDMPSNDIRPMTPFLWCHSLGWKVPPTLSDMVAYDKTHTRFFYFTFYFLRFDLNSDSSS